MERLMTGLRRFVLDSLARQISGAARTGSLRRMTQATGRLRSILPRVRHNPAFHGDVLFLLAASLYGEYELAEDLDRLAESVAVFREAAGHPHKNPEGSTMLYAQALVQAYGAFGDRAALDDALALIRAAPPGADASRLLATALIHRADRTGDGVALDEAVEILANIPQESGTSSADLLGVALCRRAERTGDEGEMREGIRILEEAIAHPPDALTAEAARNNLATVLARAAQGRGLGGVEFDAAELDRSPAGGQAVAQAGRQAVPDTLLGSLRDLAALRQAAPEAAAPPADRARLSEQVADARRRLAALPPDDPVRPHHRFVLAAALEARHSAQGGLRDLEEAAALLDEVLKSAPREGDLYSLVLDLYASVAGDLYRLTGGTPLSARAEKRLAAAGRKATGDGAALARSALAALRIQLALGRGSYRKIAAALASTPVPVLPEAGPVDAVEWHCAMVLVNARVAAARRIGAAEVFGEAVTTLERLFRSADPANPLRARVAVDLAQTTILAAAYDRVIRGVARGPDGEAGPTPRQVSDRLKAEWRGHTPLVSLVNADLVRDMLADPDDAVATALIRAARVAEEGAAQANASVPDRLTAALRWASTDHHAGRLADALRGYEVATGMLDQLAWRGLTAQDRERLLHEYDGIPRQAAACAIADGRPERAVELLEQGRATLLRQSLDTRGHDPLAAAHPRLAARLSELDERLTAAPPQAGSPRLDADGLRVDAEERMAAALAREELIAEIRSLPGFAGFLAPPRLADLRPPRDGAVVVVNTSDLGSHALVVTDTGLTVVPLGADFHDDSVRVVLDLYGGLAARDTDPDGAADTLHEVLAWLNARVCEPVGAVLPAGTTRLWWCVTGPAVLLPLHAAPPPDSPLGAIPGSYTPTFRLLRRSGEHRAAAPAPASMSASLPAPAGGVLAVTPSTSGKAALPAARRPPAALAAALPVTRLDGADATADALLAGLSDHRWLYFAGHAAQEAGSPFDTRLELADRPVTVRDLAVHHTDGAELAVVPACETAGSGGRLIDQAATLLAALQVAGFRHTVGSVWPVADLVAEQATELFYAALRSTPPDASDAGRALHETVRELRTRYGEFDPYAWAGFVHFGP